MPVTMTPPKTTRLCSSTSDEAAVVAAIADLIASGKAQRVTFLTGAGASVASGIPDFRSPGGLYDTLRPELLTADECDRDRMKQNPTHVVDKQLFLRNPLPYHEVRRPFILGSSEKQWKPTVAQVFPRLLHDRGLLKRVYTQNIDGLDFDVGLPPEKIVCVHGSIRETACESCQRDPYDGNFGAYVADVKRSIKDIYGVDATAPRVSSKIRCSECGEPTVKPSTVLYGGTMPSSFFATQESDFFPSNETDPPTDLMFVVGSSLTVHPAAGLPDAAPESCPRVLVNREAAGRFDLDGGRDYWLRGDCDRMLVRLVCRLGWLDQLVALQDLLCRASQEVVEAAVASASNGGPE